MLNVMRKHAGSWMIKVILFAIVIVFVFWGVGSFRSREASTVATVNGEIITVADFRRAYNNLIDQYRQRFGSSLNDGMIEMLNVKSQALNQLIDRAILLQEAQKLGLRVADAEVADSVMRTPVFQTDGTFDSRRYRSILAQVHLTPEEYEAEQKNVLLGEKLSRVVTGAAKVSEPEARQWYDWQNTTVNVDYVLFEPGRYDDIKPTADEIAAYFDDQQERYQTDPMIRARYVVFDPDRFRDQVTVEDDEIADYYDANMDEFSREKMVEARHILIRLDSEADEETASAAKLKADAVYKMASDGQDFAELAKTHSEGPTKDQGGYLGKFGQSQMVKPFADRAFSMAPGEISQPVKTQFGWHVIKVESIEEAATQTLEESKPRIVDKLTDRKARNLAYDKAEQFYESVYEKDDLVNNAQTFELAVMETGAFNRQGPDALNQDKSTFATAAFALAVDEISDIQDIGGRYYLIQQTEAIDADIPPLETVIAEVTADLTRKMQKDRARADADKMAADLQAGKTFEKSAAEHGVTVAQTDLFGRNAEIPNIGSDPAVGKAAFELVAPGDVSQEPVEGSAGFYLLRLVERKAPAVEGFEKESVDIKAMLLRQKQMALFQDWLEARKADSQIDKQSEYLE